MPFILRKTTSGIIEVRITRNTIFFTLPITLRLSYPRTGTLKNCKYLRDFNLQAISKWFKNTYEVLYRTFVVDIPESMTECGKLFDKNVLPIKKLVKDIGDLHSLVIKETKNFLLYDDSNLIANTFFTEVNKKFQPYGLISLEYNSNNKNLINSKNRLKFNILRNIQKEYLTLQLQDILPPKILKQLIQKIQIFDIIDKKTK